MKIHLNFSVILTFLLTISVHQLNSQTWMQENSQTAGRLRNIFFADDYTGWFFGDSSDINGFVTGIVKKTTDQGSTWNAQYLGSPELRVYSSYFLNTITGFAAGRHNASGNGFVSKTTNGGTNWVTDSLTFPDRITDIDFSDNLNGWVSGRNGLIFNTTDAGASWNSQNSNTPEHLFSVDFCNSNTGWAVGADPGTGGVIIRTTDGGVNWNLQNNTTPNDLNSVFAFDPSKAIAVGFAGTIVITLDSGTTWNPVVSGTPEDLYDVKFTDANNGWACGTAGVLIITTDGGLTWAPQNSNNAGNTIFSLSMNNLNLGWYCGDAGDAFIYRLWPLAVEQTTEISDETEVYPNPAENNITIRVKNLNEDFMVNVYDLTGKKIKSASATAGIQKINIKTDDMASGLYFYDVKREGKTCDTGRFVVK